MSRIIAFDVNETLLDLRALDGPFEELLGAAELRGQWFAQMLQLSFVGGLTGQYVDFTTAQRAALHMVARRSGRQVSDDAVTAIVQRMRSLPPHPEVATALARLAAGGLQLVALTNSVQDVAEDQLRNAGIDTHFDSILSADTVGALKPAPAPYRAVAERHGVEIGQVRLVAAHSWDIAGALAAGARAAFIARPGMVLSPLGAQPDIVGDDVAEVVDPILAADVAS
ncbi:MAG: haloacid dehalogenase type II [Solirubrobacteraceae bacterium]